MAWIHPNTNGHYRVIIVSNNTVTGTSGSLSTYQDPVAAAVNLDPFPNDDVSTVMPSGDWRALVSIDTGTSADAEGSDRARDLAADPIYNTNGDLLANSFNDLKSTYNQAVIMLFDLSTPNTTVWTGSTASLGNPGFMGNLSNGVGFDPNVGNSSTIGSGWINNGTSNENNSHPVYGISATMATISGSLSGTLTRDATGAGAHINNVWAIGAITLTGDVDFGGTKYIKEAADVSQAPSIPTFGLFKLKVGAAGSAPAGWPEFTERLSTVNTGTNNTIEGEIGGGVLVSGGVAYE